MTPEEREIDRLKKLSDYYYSEAIKANQRKIALQFEYNKDTIPKFLEDLDQRLSERIIDPCGYAPEKETREDLITSVKINSEENAKLLKRLRLLVNMNEREGRG